MKPLAGIVDYGKRIRVKIAEIGAKFIPNRRKTAENSGIREVSTLQSREEKATNLSDSEMRLLRPPLRGGLAMTEEKSPRNDTALSFRLGDNYSTGY